MQPPAVLEAPVDLNPFFSDQHTMSSEVCVLVVQRSKTEFALRREHSSVKNCDQKYSPIKLSDSQNDELSLSTFTS